jgi:hypothetical protein
MQAVGLSEAQYSGREQGGQINSANNYRIVSEAGRAVSLHLLRNPPEIGTIGVNLILCVMHVGFWSHSQVGKSEMLRDFVSLIVSPL